MKASNWFLLILATMAVQLENCLAASERQGNDSGQQIDDSQETGRGGESSVQQPAEQSDPHKHDCEQEPDMTSSSEHKKKARRLSDRMEQSADRVGQRAEEWADEFAEQMEAWADQFGDSWERWAEQHEADWERWADQYGNRWERWARHMEEGQVDKKMAKDLLRENIEMLKRMPIGTLLEQIADSAEKVREMPWDKISGLEKVVNDSLQDLLKALDEVAPEAPADSEDAAARNRQQYAPRQAREEMQRQRQAQQEAMREQIERINQTVREHQEQARAAARQFQDEAEKLRAERERQKREDSVLSGFARQLIDKVRRLDRTGDRRAMLEQLTQQLQQEKERLAAELATEEQLREEARQLRREIEQLKQQLEER